MTILAHIVLKLNGQEPGTNIRWGIMQRGTVRILSFCQYCTRTVTRRMQKRSVGSVHQSLNPRIIEGMNAGTRDGTGTKAEVIEEVIEQRTWILWSTQDSRPVSRSAG